MVYCVVPFCTSNSLKDSISFHEVPVDSARREQWAKAISREGPKKGSLWIPQERHSVCGKHFLPSDYKINLKSRRLTKNAIPSVFPPYSQYMLSKVGRRKILLKHAASDGSGSSVQSSQPPDKKLSRDRRCIAVMSKEKSSENLVYEKYNLESSSKTFKSTNFMDVLKLKMQEAPAQTDFSQSHLYSYLSEKVTEKKFLTMNLTSNIEKIDPKNLISDISGKENTDLNSTQEQYLYTQKDYFTYEKLVENLSLIKKPNLWWTVSTTGNFIICARWNSEYVAEKRIVIENTLTIRVFLKDMKINITDLMDISCTDDISNLLEKVENYQDSTES